MNTAIMVVATLVGVMAVILLVYAVLALNEQNRRLKHLEQYTTAHMDGFQKRISRLERNTGIGRHTTAQTWQYKSH